MSTHYQPHFEAPRREDVEDCKNVETLLAWHTECYEVADSARSQIEARNLSGTADQDWLYRASDKLAIVMTCARRIERRLAALGADMPTTRDNAEQRTIRRLRGQIKDLRKALRDAGVADPTEGRN